MGWDGVGVGKKQEKKKEKQRQASTTEIMTIQEFIACVTNMHAVNRSSNAAIDLFDPRSWRFRGWNKQDTIYGKHGVLEHHQMSDQQVLSLAWPYRS